jgi:hypothetical protein
MRDEYDMNLADGLLARTEAEQINPRGQRSADHNVDLFRRLSAMDASRYRCPFCGYTAMTTEEACKSDDLNRQKKVTLFPSPWLVLTGAVIMWIIGWLLSASSLCHSIF